MQNLHNQARFGRNDMKNWL